MDVEKSLNNLRISSRSPSYLFLRQVQKVLECSSPSALWDIMVQPRCLKAMAAPNPVEYGSNSAFLFIPNRSPSPEATVPVDTITSVAPANMSFLVLLNSSERTKMGVSGKASLKHSVAFRHLSGSRRT